jgi:hypothetical protein
VVGRSTAHLLRLVSSQIEASCAVPMELRHRAERSQQNWRHQAENCPTERCPDITFRMSRHPDVLVAAHLTVETVTGGAPPLPLILGG